MSTKVITPQRVLRAPAEKGLPGFWGQDLSAEPLHVPSNCIKTPLWGVRSQHQSPAVFFGKEQTLQGIVKRISLAGSQL